MAPALGDDGTDGEAARARLRGERLAAPELIDLQVASVWHRQQMAGLIDERRVGLALDDLAQLPLLRVRHRPLVGRCWQLRQNVTIYDASYIALAELLGGDPGHR